MRMPRVVAGRVGRRGGFLLFLAVLDLLYGWSLLGYRFPGYHLFLPPTAWGSIWMGTGVVCLAGSAVRRDRIPYTIGATMMGVWGVLFLHVWAVQHVPRTWVSAVVWLAFGLVTVMIASWPEPVVIVLNGGERS